MKNLSDKAFILMYLEDIKHDRPSKEETNRFNTILKKYPLYKKYIHILPVKEVKKILSNKSKLTKNDLKNIEKKEYYKRCKTMVKKYSQKKRSVDLVKYKSLKKNFDKCKKTIQK
jgi:hypothetical protein